MSTLSTYLFGGALFAAGLAHAAPELQPVVAYEGIPATKCSLIGLTFSPDTVDSVVGTYHDPAQAMFDLQASVPGWRAHAYVSALGFGISAYGEPDIDNGYAGRFARAYFTVSEPADLVCRWDFSQEIPGSRFQSGGCGVSEIVDGSAQRRLSVWPDNGAPDAGARRVRVLPGHIYRGFSFAYAINPDTTVSFSATLDDPCYADCGVNGVVNVDDIDCFVSAFLAGEFAGADCTGNGVINLDDIDCFVTSFLDGCP